MGRKRNFSPSPSSSFSKTLATQATARLRTSKHHRAPTQSAFITVWDFTVIVLYLGYPEYFYF